MGSNNSYGVDAEKRMIGLDELWHALFAKRFWIIGTVLLFAAGMYVYCAFILSPKYTAQCTLFLLNRSKEENLTSSDITASNALLKDYEILTKTHAVIDRVIEKLDLSYDYSYSELKNEIQVSIPKDSRMLIVCVTDKDPKNAQKLANAISDELVEQIETKMRTEASVIDYAVVPKTASSPNVKRNTIISATVGFLLVVAFVIIRFLSDKTFKTEADIEKYLDVPILGTIPMERIENVNKKKLHEK